MSSAVSRCSFCAQSDGADFAAQYHDVAQASHIAVRVRIQCLRSISQKRRSPSPAPVATSRIVCASYVYFMDSSCTSRAAVVGYLSANAPNAAQKQAQIMRVHQSAGVFSHSSDGVDACGQRACAEHLRVW